MNVVDSSAWLEYFADGPNAAAFAKPIEATRLSMDHGLAMADSVMLAAAQRHGAVLWTQDADFDGLPGTRYFAKR